MECRFQRSAVILVYEKEVEGKSRQRIMPARNVSKFSDCVRATEQLIHATKLPGTSVPKAARDVFHASTRSFMWTKFSGETPTDPEEDTNKLDDKELAKRKSIMDELFEKIGRRVI